MATKFALATSINTEGQEMAFEFTPSMSWQAFSISGLPSDQQAHIGKRLTLANAVKIWNASVKARKDQLQIVNISNRIRDKLNTERDAAARAVRARPQPNF